MILPLCSLRIGLIADSSFFISLLIFKIVFHLSSFFRDSGTSVIPVSISSRNDPPPSDMISSDTKTSVITPLTVGKVSGSA